MLTFLFWNIQKKPLLARVARLATRHSVDVLMLAECNADPPAVLAALGTGWAYPPSEADKVLIFTRPAGVRIGELFNEANGRLSIREVRPVAGPSFLLAAAHLPSKFGWSDHDQAELSQFLAGEIERIEDLNRNTRTVLVGDLNMNPFDPGLVSGFGFHALMTRDLAARRGRRVVQGRTCRRAFFNPMWEFLADRPGRPSGTYYRDVANPVNHFWHALDQVLVRPELSDKLVAVDVLDHDGTDPLTASGGWPDVTGGSDHLPLLFQLDL